ncbi:hypothetical protein N9B48_02355, partial [bacterium]|nr:hypothetical protein [bacterium]
RSFSTATARRNSTDKSLIRFVSANVVTSTISSFTKLVRDFMIRFCGFGINSSVIANSTSADTPNPKVRANRADDLILNMELPVRKTQGNFDSPGRLLKSTCHLPVMTGSKKFN